MPTPVSTRPATLPKPDLCPASGKPTAPPSKTPAATKPADDYVCYMPAKKGPIDFFINEPVCVKVSAPKPDPAPWQKYPDRFCNPDAGRFPWSPRLSCHLEP